MACLHSIKGLRVMKNTTLTIPAQKLLRLPEVLLISRLSKSSVYVYMNAGTFPKSISLGERSVAWVESEVLQWIDDRINERDQMVA